MKLLIATDIHGNREVLKKLLNQEFDYLVILGDLTNKMREMDLFDLLPKDKTFFVPGNNELPELGIHGEVVKLENYNFFFLGGSLPTPFNTPNEIEEDEYERIIKAVEDRIDHRTVIFSHSPPYGVLDLVGGRNLGIKALRAVIEEKQPLAVFCGHVHEYQGHMAYIGNTLVINPGFRGIFLHL